MATPKATPNKKSNGRPVIVTTAHRGVFFGYADNTDGDAIALKQARLCVYWTADLRGFMGLASSGPGRGCKIGPPADITLRAITAVVEVSDEAAARWESAPALHLARCPFCGGQAHTGEVDGEPSVWCSMCGATVRTYSETGAVDL